MRQEKFTWRCTYPKDLTFHDTFLILNLLDLFESISNWQIMICIYAQNFITSLPLSFFTSLHLSFFTSLPFSFFTSLPFSLFISRPFSFLSFLYSLFNNSFSFLNLSWIAALHFVNTSWSTSEASEASRRSSTLLTGAATGL